MLLFGGGGFTGLPLFGLVFFLKGGGGGRKGGGGCCMGDLGLGEWGGCANKNIQESLKERWQQGVKGGRVMGRALATSG